MKIKTKISAKAYLIALIATIAVAFTGLLAFLADSRLADAKGHGLEQARLFASIAARALDNFQTDLLVHAQQQAALPRTYRALKGDCGSWLAQASIEMGSSEISITSLSGELACSSRPEGQQLNSKALLRNLFQDSMDMPRRGGVGSVFKDQTQWVFAIGFPIIGDSGSAEGYWIQAFPSMKLDSLRAVLVDKGARLIFIDPNARVGIADPSNGQALAMGEQATPELLRLLQPGAIHNGHELDSGFFASGAKVSNSKWHAIALINQDAVYSPAKEQIINQSIVLALLGLFSIYGIYGIANRLSSATGILVKAAGNAETLFSAMNTGVSEIDKGLDNLRENNREKLKAQAAAELWRIASERTRSGMAILKKQLRHGGHPALIVEICNPAFESLSGMGAAVGKDILRDFPERSSFSDPAVCQELRASCINAESASRSAHGLDAEGRIAHVQLTLEPIEVEESSAAERFCITLEDVTEIAIREAELAKQSTTDALTNLPNRSLFASLLSKSISMSVRKRSRCAVAFFDLDHFKFINDSIGHDKGDLVIAEVAKRLSERLRPGDTISRFGGDEFGLVFADVDSIEMIATLVEHFRDALMAPMQMAGKTFTITCSAGVAVYPDDGEDPASLMKAADIAMFQAKENGRGNVKFHSRNMSESFAERMTIEQALKQSLADNKLNFLYQPKVSLATGQPCGMEALARWRHPELGEISPAKFIPLAEESELIATLGDMAIRSALRDAKILWEMGFKNMPVAINVSARQIKEGFTEKLIAELRESKLPASAVHVEITESSVMPNSDATKQFLDELHRLGIKVALDDFGTGWSNMAMLKTLPLSYLKMDKSFVDGLGKDDKDAAIAKAIVGLAKALGVQVIAEGVETQLQAQQLVYLGADQLQGYYVCKPMSIEDVSAWLNSGGVFQGQSNQALQLPGKSDLAALNIVALPAGGQSPSEQDS